jgi:hypothetical protein
LVQFGPAQTVDGGFVDLRKVFGLEDLPDLDLFSALERSVREALDQLVFRTRLEDPEARDDFFGFGERAVGDRGAFARVADPRALRARLKSLGGEHDAVANQRLVERPHLGAG